MRAGAALPVPLGSRIGVVVELRAVDVLPHGAATTATGPLRTTEPCVAAAGFWGR